MNVCGGVKCLFKNVVSWLFAEKILPGGTQAPPR